MLRGEVSSSTDGIKVKTSVVSVYCMPLHLSSALPFCFRLKGFLFCKTEEQQVLREETCWRAFSEPKPTVPSSSFFPLLLLNGSICMPQGVCLHSEECWFWSSPLIRVKWKSKYDWRIRHPGPESSQDTSLTRKAKELWQSSWENRRTPCYASHLWWRWTYPVSTCLKRSAEADATQLSLD